MASTNLPVEQSTLRLREYLEGERDFTDSGNANTLLQLIGGELRYVRERDQWLIWRSRRWEIDTHASFVREQARQVAYFYLLNAQRERQAKDGDRKTADKLEKWGRHCRNTPALDRMLRELQTMPDVAISTETLDRDPWLLGVANGVVDLRTGELRGEAIADLVTRRAAVAYEPNAAAPRWQKLVDEVTGTPIVDGEVGSYTPRPELAAYVQRMLGYMCTGLTREQKLFFAIGKGSNGKNVLFEAVSHVLGTYAVVLPAEALMTAKIADAERASPVIASLAGSRFAMASESKSGHKLDVGAVKNLTGDAKMTARRLYQDAETFFITAKILLLTNLRPDLDHLDEAIRGRLHFIPFDRKWNRPGEVERDPMLPDGDPNLSSCLQAEAAGILTWLVQGAIAYGRDGLQPPADVVSETRGYLFEQDALARWISKDCETCPVQEGELAQDLHMTFIQWCLQDETVCPYQSAKAFGAALDQKMIASKRTKDGARRGLRRRCDLA